MYTRIDFRHIEHLPDLLHSSDVELRIEAGETLALLYELAREEDEVNTVEFCVIVVSMSDLSLTSDEENVMLRLLACCFSCH